MDWLTWYNGLQKPGWTPSPATISLIWTILYPIIFVTFGFVFVQWFRRKVSGPTALPFAINLMATLLFMPFLSGLRNIGLATIDIVIVWLSIIWCMVAIAKYYRVIAFAQIPYFVWVSIAMSLQVSIWAMNRNSP